MFKCELCGTEFLFQGELNDHLRKSIEHGKQIGGKFALLARILEGDESAAILFRQYIDAGVIGPDFDHIPSTN